MELSSSQGEFQGGWLNLLASETFRGCWEPHSIEGLGEILFHDPHSMERHVRTGVMVTILALKKSGAP